MSRLTRNQAGDTIVEVLIVIIVLATVLASAYGIAVSSLQATQLTQEKAYALKLAEGQLENLKSAIAAAADATPITGRTDGFCFDNNLNMHTIASGSPNANYQADNFANYPAECKQDPTDPVNKSCTNYCYYIGLIRYTPSLPPESTHNFTVSVRWVGARGARQQSQLTYKVYKND